MEKGYAYPCFSSEEELEAKGAQVHTVDPEHCVPIMTFHDLILVSRLKPRAGLHSMTAPGGMLTLLW